MSTSLHLSVKEFDRMVACGAFDHLDRKIELIGGELHAMNPAGPLHDDLIQYLVNWSGRSIPDGVSVTSQTGLDLQSLQSRPEPDLMWIRTKRYRGRHPGPEDVFLAIEAVDSSLQRDLNLKSIIYARGWIPEYWVFDATAEEAHVFREPTEGGYADRQTVSVDACISPLAAPTAQLSLHDLYRG